MKIYSVYSVFLFITAFLFVSCNTDEGLGGSSSIEGYVYQVRHWEKDYSHIIDTIPAADTRVQLIFGGNSSDFYGDDIRTDGEGLYRFNYLRNGNYVVSSLSEQTNGEMESVFMDVKVDKKQTRADTIYVHSIVKKGFASIKGSVIAHYYDKGKKVDEGAAIEKRIFINKVGADTYFDDVRVGAQGYFVFTGVPPGQYEIWTTTEDPNTEKLSVVKQIIEVKEKSGLYELEESFVVIITV